MRVSGVRWTGWAVFLCVVLAVAGCGGGGTPQPAKLAITTTPAPDASVTVEGVSYGTAPVTVDNVAPGTVVVVLEREGYKRTVKTVTVPDKGGTVEACIELDPMTGYVTFNSVPSGAEIVLDGDRSLGRTPLTRVPVSVGEHTYEAKLENHLSVSNTVAVEADYQYSFTPELRPLQAQLSVLSTPSGAQISINDESLPQVTPAKFSLVPGTYTVSVYAAGFVQSDQSVALAANETKTLEFGLEAGQAPPNMVLVPAGKFTMGADDAAPDEKPRREIELPAFYIDKYEVTNEEFKKVFPSHTFDDGQGRFPATGVSYNQALEYAQAVGKRLPTEQEWEKAARGTDARQYPWGNDFDKARCNFEGTLGGGATQKVGTYKTGVSPCGCMDMAGNVYEWTQDWYQPYPGNPVVTKDYGQIFRVLRGGSFKSGLFDVRGIRRHYDRMDKGREDYGLRCAKDAEAR